MLLYCNVIQYLFVVSLGPFVRCWCPRPWTYLQMWLFNFLLHAYLISKPMDLNYSSSKMSILCVQACSTCITIELEPIVLNAAWSPSPKRTKSWSDVKWCEVMRSDVKWCEVMWSGVYYCTFWRLGHFQTLDLHHTVKGCWNECKINKQMLPNPERAFKPDAITSSCRFSASCEASGGKSFTHVKMPISSLCFARSHWSAQENTFRQNGSPSKWVCPKTGYTPYEA